MSGPAGRRRAPDRPAPSRRVPRGRETDNRNSLFRDLQREPGYSLLEILVAVTIVLTVSAAAIPQTLLGLDEVRAAAAARYLAGRLQWCRQYAAGRAVAVGLQFQQVDGRYCYGTYRDGNHNGVRARDIERRVDTPVRPLECLSDVASGADLGFVDGVPIVGAVAAGDNRDPVRLGRTSILTLSATGSATPGTLYIRAGHRGQYAVRVLGATGRIRVLAFDWRARRWVAE